MNRKLHNTLLALSTTGLVLVAGLLVATPLTSAPAIDGNSAALAGMVVVAPAQGTTQANIERTARLEARTQRFESDMRRISDTCDALAHTASFVAEIAADTALAAAVAGIESATTSNASQQRPIRIKKRIQRSAHSAFATPYFSFAHGLRDGTGA